MNLIKYSAMIEEKNLKCNNVFIGGKDKLPDWFNKDKVKENLHQVFKNYLELDNVSFLFGAGTSADIGGVSIRNIPKEIERLLIKDSDEEKLFRKTILDLQGTDKIQRDEETKEIKYPFEDLLNYLLALHFINSKGPKSDEAVKISELLKILKFGLFKLCDIEIRKNTSDDKSLEENKYYYHEKFLKKILQRPLNLKRVNLFTTNYDLAFEYAFDKLGVHYIDGFSGFHKRIFKPETYDYDLYFPGSTTQGKVQRIEKVLRYFKLHGSLSWINTEAAASNVYGIEEYPMNLLRSKVKEDIESIDELFGKLMIYPSANKKSYTLEFPYSELFRQFSTAINRPQSVLITYGYSFNDEHINDLIYQALTIPSFTLIVIAYHGTKINERIRKLNELNDPRIIIIQGELLASFSNFSERLLPDFIDINVDEKIAETMNVLYPQNRENDNTKAPKKEEKSTQKELNSEEDDW